MVTAPTAEDYGACLAEAPRTVVTAAGPVEYARRGHGDLVLAIHGTLGGWDQGLVEAEFLRVNGYGIIAPSRPGYLGTPLSTGRSFPEQGDALAALLDALGIDRIIVLGVSGGGPASYELAARHPDRVSMLVQIDSVCVPGHTPGRLSQIAASDLAAQTQLWLLRHARRATLRALLRGSGTYARAEAKARATELAAKPGSATALEATLRASLGGARRRAGMRNDFQIFTPAPLELITARTLVVHGRYDKIVPPANAEYALSRVSLCEVHWMEGSHVAFGLEAAESAPAHVVSWLGTT